MCIFGRSTSIQSRKRATTEFHCSKITVKDSSCGQESGFDSPPVTRENDGDFRSFLAPWCCVITSCVMLYCWLRLYFFVMQCCSVCVLLHCVQLNLLRFFSCVIAFCYIYIFLFLLLINSVKLIYFLSSVMMK